MGTVAEGDLKELIRASGLRATGARVAVLRFLRGVDGPRSHGDVAEALVDQGFDRATLFRNLNDLATAGLLHRFDAGDHVWRFELAPPSGHAHFVCTDCGEVSCLEGVDVQVADRLAPNALIDGAVQIQLRGRCDACG
ncbi:MAG: transcriptional repressor [Myxococcota bacterium]